MGTSRRSTRDATSGRESANDGACIIRLPRFARGSAVVAVSGGYRLRTGGGRHARAASRWRSGRVFPRRHAPHLGRKGRGGRRAGRVGDCAPRRRALVGRGRRGRTEPALRRGGRQADRPRRFSSIRRARLSARPRFPLASRSTSPAAAPPPSPLLPRPSPPLPPPPPSAAAASLPDLCSSSEKEENVATAFLK